MRVDGRLRLKTPRITKWLGLGLGLLATRAQAMDLPAGYLVWIKGELNQMSSRKVYRMTLPGKTDIQALTSGEDVEANISPDGKWVAYAKAKVSNSDYHLFNRWKIYLVSIHGAGEGREEIKIDDNGYWPSWGGPNVLYYSQVDYREGDEKQHTFLMKVTLDEYGTVLTRTKLVSTRELFPSFSEINECFMAPDESWYVCRTRGSLTINGVSAFTVDPPQWKGLLAKAGSVGCMPHVAPSGEWGYIAGREMGIRWGDRPDKPGGLSDQELIAPFSADDLVYHPAVSNDEHYVMAAHSTDSEHNAGAYDVYLHALEGQKAGPAEALLTGGFNGWPQLWIGQPGPPPPPRPHVDQFYPESYTLVRGEKTVLHWKTSFADSLLFDGAPVVPDQVKEGTLTIQPSETTTYQLEAQNTQAAEPHESTVTVTVTATPQPVVIEMFSVTPETIEVGQNATLSWRINYPTTLDLNGMAVAPEGSLLVEPTKTMDYTITARSDSGAVTRTVTLKVAEVRSMLLPDRGGCTCGDASPEGFIGAWSLWLLGWALLRRPGLLSRAVPV